MTTTTLFIIKVETSDYKTGTKNESFTVAGQDVEQALHAVLPKINRDTSYLKISCFPAGGAILQTVL